MADPDFDPMDAEGGAGGQGEPTPDESDDEAINELAEEEEEAEEADDYKESSEEPVRGLQARGYATAHQQRLQSCCMPRVRSCGKLHSTPAVIPLCLGALDHRRKMLR
jgi:hypothetical protein